MNNQLFTAIACLAMLSGCGDCRGDSHATGISVGTGGAPGGARQFGEADLVFEINGTSIALNTDVQVLLDERGHEYQLSEAPSCVYEGMDKSFEYTDLSAYTYPLDGRDLLDEIILTSPEHQTPRGLRVGDTLEEAVALYGESYRDEGGILYYCLNPDPDVVSPCLYLVIEGAVISSISFYSASNVP